MERGGELARVVAFRPEGAGICDVLDIVSPPARVGDSYGAAVASH